MPGFPNRIKRTSLGPEVVDTWPVTDERKAIPARTFNLEKWQVAGMNLTAALATIGVRIVGGSPVTVYQTFAFDPNQVEPLLLWSKIGVGEYAYSLPKSDYEDEAGNLVTVSFLGGIPHVQGYTSASNLATAHHVKTGPRSGTVVTRALSIGNPPFDLLEGNEFILVLY